jgi:rubrerythrin
MPLLKAEPAGSLSSLDELFALAHAMETDAAASYSQFAEAMRRQGQLELAAVFDAVATEERGHAANVGAWAEQKLGHLPDPAAKRWPAPPTFEADDAAEMAGSNLLTPYRVLTVATRNEERAFAFWSYVAAHATQPEVRRAAETMAKEELGHVAAFRRERRRAFHAARAGNSPASVRQPASEMELQLGNLLEQRATGEFSSLAQESRRMAQEVRAWDIQGYCPPSPTPEALAEALVDLYLESLDGAEGSRHDAIQQLAERAIKRLAGLGAGQQ